MTEAQVWLLIAVQVASLLAAAGGLGVFIWRVGRWVGALTAGFSAMRCDVLEVKAAQISAREETRDSFREVHRRVDALYVRGTSA